MPMKVFMILLFLVLAANAVEFEWDDNSVGLSKSAQVNALNEFIDLKYPKEAKLRREKLKLEKQLREKEERRKFLREIRKNTVTINGLMWQDNYASKTIKRDWRGAKNYCSQLKLLGFSDWFLPSIEQLKSIVDEKRNPTIKKEFNNIISNYYWSSSPDVSHSYDAWNVNFKFGYSGSNYKTFDYYVRCARAGQ
jgi:hypothetical protein